jgi:hypothetical protein
MSSSLFVKYGVKAGGGPAFLKRTRTAVGQLQTRTRTGFNFNQPQQRNANKCLPSGVSRCRDCWRWTDWFNVGSCSAGGYSFCNPTTRNDPGGWPRECRTIQSCGWNAYSGWSNVSSCSPSTPACSQGALERQCQTIYNWGAWSAYEETDICTPQSPNPSAGAVQIECVAQ